MQSAILTPRASRALANSLAVCIERAEGLAQMAVRVVVFALLITLVIPASIHIANMIDDIYHESIEATIDAAVETGALFEEEEAADKNLWDRISGTAQSILDGAAGLIDWAKSVLNNYIEALAVFVVTCCLIPILVFLCFAYILRSILHIDIRRHMRGFQERQRDALDRRRRPRTRRIEE